jgi:hypothetical protein
MQTINRIGLGGAERRRVGEEERRRGGEEEREEREGIEERCVER